MTGYESDPAQPLWNCINGDQLLIGLITSKAELEQCDQMYIWLLRGRIQDLARAGSDKRPPTLSNCYCCLKEKVQSKCLRLFHFRGFDRTTPGCACHMPKNSMVWFTVSAFMAVARFKPLTIMNRYKVKRQSKTTQNKENVAIPSNKSVTTETRPQKPLLSVEELKTFFNQP